MMAQDGRTGEVLVATLTTRMMQNLPTDVVLRAIGDGPTDLSNGEVWGASRPFPASGRIQRTLVPRLRSESSRYWRPRWIVRMSGGLTLHLML
jgi:hypothetical protein